MDHDRVKGSLRGEAEVNPVHKFSAPLKPATANDLMRGLIQYSGKHGARAETRVPSYHGGRQLSASSTRNA